MKNIFDSLSDLQLLAYRLKIMTYRKDAFTGRYLQPMLDSYMIQRLADGRYGFNNLRTGHNYTVSSDLLLSFEADKYNYPGDLQNGILRIRGSFFQTGNHVEVLPAWR